MSAETPHHRQELQNILRKFIHPQKAWAPEEAIREGFVQNIEILKDAVKEVLLNADDALQERLNFLADYPEGSNGFTVEKDRNKIITKPFVIGLGEKENVYFIARNPRIQGEEIHKFALYSSITTREELLSAIKNFILLEPEVNQRVGVSHEAILAKMERYGIDVKKDKIVEDFRNSTKNK